MKWLVFIAVMAITGSAQAQVVCAMRLFIVDFLEETRYETPATRGLSDSGKVIELFTSSNGTNWSMVRTEPNGVACVVEQGNELKYLKPMDLGVPL